jgi:hypothetical protein
MLIYILSLRLTTTFHLKLITGNFCDFYAILFVWDG